MLELASLLKTYQAKKLTIGVLGSHSALEVCFGAKKLGFKTLVVAQKGREQTYAKYYRAEGLTGCVDSCLTLGHFSEILQPSIQQQLRKKRVIFIPHRSFEVYLNFDYQTIENEFAVPLFGNRYLLKIEERGISPNQYDLLAAAKIPYPKIFNSGQEIDRLSLVKIQEKARGFERAFFLVENPQDYQRQVEKKLKQGWFTPAQLKKSVIEEFILGVQVNFNFFYSPLEKRLELLGTDTRRQTNLEGISKLPYRYQKQSLGKIAVKYEEAGHIAVTVLESLLEPAFALGERFVRASQQLFPPGIIGPFALQSIITPGPPRKEIVVTDVSPRMPGSPGITATPYTAYRYGRPVSVGERMALEIKKAHQRPRNRLSLIVT